MRISKKVLLGLTLVTFLPAAILRGQTPFRTYSVRSGPDPNRAAKIDQLRELMVQGWQLKPDEAEKLEGKLAQNPDNLPLRLRLMSYYSQYRKTDAHASHVLWLIEHHPAEDVLEESSPIVRLEPSPAVARQAALWKLQASRFPADPKVQRNAAVAMFGADPVLAISYVKAARQTEPQNAEWTTWLAKIYATAIRWTYWDGAAMIAFTGNSEDFRHPVAFLLPLELCRSAKAEIEASTDANLVEAVGHAMVREVSLLGQQDSTPDLAPYRQDGARLIERARVLRAGPR
jgi:hypothetical protein